MYIQATLIVTPPALAAQWRDELTAHAPSLKVLVYDGWNKVQVPITGSKADLDAAAKPKLKERKKLKKPAKIRRTTGTRPADESHTQGTNDEQATVSHEIKTHDDEGNPLIWCDFVHQYDVVITTYSVLRSEIWVARPPPDRPRREDALYTAGGRARSPLVMVEWKRVVMDEVQMVGGGSAA